MNDTLKVWVYGTLKVGGRFAGEFDKDRLSVAKATTRGTMYDVMGGFPAVIFDGKNELHGEVHEYKNAEEVEQHFDAIEGYGGPNDPGNLYNKKKIKVMLNGKEVECTTYEFARIPDEYDEVESGFWEV